MSSINSVVQPFQAQAYHQGKFVSVSEADIRGMSFRQRCARAIESIVGPAMKDIAHLGW